MALIFDARKWWQSEMPHKLSESLESYVQTVRDEIYAIWNDIEAREELLNAIKNEAISALQQTALSLKLLGTEAGYYFPVSPDLVTAAVLIMLGLYTPQGEKKEGKSAPSKRKRNQRR